MTAPVSVGKIVAGKFLALTTIFATPVLIMCLYPIILSKFGTMPFKTAYTNIFGLFLYGLVLIAIGTFISSISESQVISAILSIVVLFIGYLMGSLTSLISSGGNILTKILGCFDLYSPVQNFLNGQIRLSDVVYYISLTVLFLFLTCQSIQKRRWNVSKKTIGTGIFSTGFIAIVVALVVFVNLIAGTLTTKETWASIDMTSQKLFSISKTTTDMLKKVDSDINVYVMSSKGDMDDTVKKTLERYTSASKHIKVEYKDTTVYPNFYKDFTDTAPSAKSLIVYNSKNKKSKVIDYNNIYVTDSNSYYSSQSSASQYDCEGQLDSAISYVRTNKTATIYEVDGHNEVGLDSNTFGTDNNLKEIIEKYNCEVETVKLLGLKEISTKDCAALLILGPQKDYTKDEAKMVIDYLNNGGKVIIGLENMISFDVDKPNFNSILKEFNIQVNKGIVAENDSSYYSPQYGAYYAFSEGKEGFANSLTSYIFTPYTSGIKQINKKNSDVTYMALASTSDKAVLKKNPTSIKTYEKEKGDEEGSFDTIVYATKNITARDSSETKTADLLVFGSVYSLADSIDEYVQGSNTQIVNNALKEFIDTDVETVSVPAKSLQSTQLTVTESGTRVFGVLIAIVLPVIVLAWGIVVWIRRRKY